MFSSFISQFSSPPILVLPSPSIDTTMGKNHLSFTELLKPFGLALDKLSQGLIFRTPNRIYHLKNWNVRFVSINEMEYMDAKLADKYLDYVLTLEKPSKERSKDQITSVYDVASFTRLTPDPTPWYTRYRSDHVECLRFSEIELLDQPLGMMVVVDGNESLSTATGWIEATKSNKNMPSSFGRGIYDTQLVRAILIVHDRHREKEDKDSRGRALELHKQLSSKYTDICQLLEINSLPYDTPNPSQRDLWSHHILRSRLMNAFGKQLDGRSSENISGGIDGGVDMSQTLNDDNRSNILAEFGLENEGKMGLQAREETSPPPPQSILDSIPNFLAVALSTPPQTARGQYIAPIDIENIYSVLQHFFSTLILPNIEKRMAVLSEKVAAVRKGLRNAFKSLFGSRPSREKGGRSAFNQQTLTYELVSAESQTRQLSDLCYVMQDYEQAVVNYKLCLTDYKNDKTFRHLASAYEMIGLSLCMSGDTAPNSMREMITSIESSYNTYSSLHDSRRLSRLVMLAIEAYRSTSTSRIPDAISLSVKGSERDSTVRSALLLEQAAYLELLLPAGPLIRKYAFHLVLAAHSYHKYNHHPHGVRCMSCAQSIYDDKSWTAIDEYMQLRLGRESYLLSSYSQAIHFLIALVGKPQAGGVDTSMEKQEMYLNELLYVVKRWYNQNGNKDVPGLELPCWIDSSVAVVLNNNSTIPTCYTAGTWGVAVRAQSRMTLNTEICNRPLFVPSMSLYKENDRVGIVNEPITIHVQIMNPLHVSLPITQIKLKVKHTHKDVNDETTTTESTNSIYLNESISVTLGANETRWIALTLIPLREGTLLIEGVNWQVLDMLHAYHQFALPMRTVPLPPGRRGQPKLEPDSSLYIPVLPSLPLLSLTLSPLPTQMFHGEYIRSTLTLLNEGPIPLHKVSVRPSHPGFILIGNGNSLPENSNNFVDTNVIIYAYDWNESMINLIDIELMPQESVTLPVYIRATVDGSHDLSFLFRYEPNYSHPSLSFPTGTKPKHPLSYRLAYFQFPLEATPLFHVKVFTKPSFVNVQDHLLGVEILDKQTQIESKKERVHISIVSVSVSSKCWAIAPVGVHPNIELLASPSQSPTPSESPSRSTSVHDLPSLKLTLPTSPYPTAQSPTASPSLPLLPAHAPTIKSVANAPASLGVNESNLLFFRISPLSSLALPPPIQATTIPLYHSVVNFPFLSPPQPNSNDGLMLDPSHPPVSNLCGVEKALMIDEERQALIVNPSTKVNDIGAGNKLDLVISYIIHESNESIGNKVTNILSNNDYTESVTSSASFPRYGVCHMPGLSSMKVLPSACPLKVQLCYPHTVPHSFSSQSPILTLPIELHIKNLSEDTPVSFTFETLAVEEEFDSIKRAFKQVNSSLLHTRYIWHGSTRCKINSLEAQGTTIVRVFADFFIAGEYNLNRFRFTVEVGGGKKPRVFFFPLQHLIRINESTGGRRDVGDLTEEIKRTNHVNIQKINPDKTSTREVLEEV